MKKILIANRGEIAIRIARAAAELDLRTVAIYSSDDAKSLHICTAEQAYALKGRGVSAYMDMVQIISVAKAANCDAIHPGYGFLSENATFARLCVEEGLKFIGPNPDILELFGDKIKARSLARRCGVPIFPGTQGATSLEEARDFFLSLGPGAAVMIKAVMGGGGRGMRAVYNLSDLDEAYTRCRSEAHTAFGLDEVYVERFINKPRHIEVQIIGDGKRVIHLGERDCTMQRRNQKLIEMTPCPTLSRPLRDKIIDAALYLAQEASFDSLGTFEFLVERNGQDEASFAFMEANPRLQVEHTVTEEVTGVDLVKAQIEIAGGKSLADIGLTENAPRPRFYAMQLRINMENIDYAGSAHPTGGTLSVYEAPSGPGIRVDGYYGYSGYSTNPAFDSLLAKLVVTSRSPRYEDVLAKTYRALSEFRVEGVKTNIPFLLNLLRRPEVAQNDFYMNAMFKAAAGAQGNGVSTSDILLSVAPLYHIAGMLMGLNITIYANATTGLLYKFDPETVLQAVDKYKCTWWYSIAPMNMAVMQVPNAAQYNLSFLKTNLSTSFGITLTAELSEAWSKFTGGCKLYEAAYGLSETHTGDTFMPPDAVKWGTQGVPTYETAIKIVDTDTGEDKAPGEMGEIVVSNPGVFKGYWQKPEATAQTLRDGWVYTGDMGKLDEEGYLTFMGRFKEMIKVSGFSVFPEEVESMLIRHPAIAQAAVIGIPDTQKGEIVKAFVVLKPSQEASPSEIITWAKERMAYYKCPREVEIKQALPATGTGKLLRRLLKEDASKAG